MLNKLQQRFQEQMMASESRHQHEPREAIEKIRTQFLAELAKQNVVNAEAAFKSNVPMALREAWLKDEAIADAMQAGRKAEEQALIFKRRVDNLEMERQGIDFNAGVEIQNRELIIVELTSSCRKAEEEVLTLRRLYRCWWCSRWRWW